MPKIDESCEIVVNGTVYRDWKTVVVERSTDDWASYANVSIIEVGNSKHGWTTQRLKIGDQASVRLAGRTAINGYIDIRQAAYDSAQHGVQVRVMSKNIEAARSSVLTKGGEFKNYPMTAIASSILAPFGVSFKIKGSPDGVDKPFPYERVMGGETPFEMIERLRRFRNVFITDDVDGNLVAFRASGKEVVVAQLSEGGNIKSARAVLSNAYAAQGASVVGQRKGSDDEYGDDLRVSATAANSAYFGKAIVKLIAEGPVDQKDAQMRADHEMAQMIASQVECEVIVKGWLMDDGSLWMEHVGDAMSVYSPMLFPDDQMNLVLHGVKHSQDEGGTQTTLSLRLFGAYGAPIGLGGPPGVGASPATSDQGDS